MLANQFKTHFRKNIGLAYPVMLSQLGNVLVGVADSIMVGKLGTIPLAAASLGNSIFYVVFLFGIGISYAMTPLVAHADGEQNVSKSEVYFKHGMLINLASGIILFLVIFVLSHFLQDMGQPENVVELTRPYLLIIMLSLIPFMFFQSFKQFAEGLSLTKFAMVVTIGANVVNIGLNYLLIYGKFSFPALGLNGAGIATLISRVLMAIGMAIFVWKGSRFRMYHLRNIFNCLSKAVTLRMVKIGVPVGLQFLFEVGAFSSAAIMMGWLGAKELAAHQIAINLASVSYMCATGIAAAATVRIGNELGKASISSLRHAGFASFIMVIAFMAFCALAFIVGKNLLPSLYIREPEVIAVASVLLVVAAFFQISDGVQVVALGCLRGLADVKVPTLVTLVAYWVIGLPLGYLLAFKFNFGPTGIWYGLLAGLTVAAITLSIRFQSLSKRLLYRKDKALQRAERLKTEYIN